MALYRMLAPASTRPPFQIGAAVFNAAPGVVVDVDANAASSLEGEGWTRLGFVAASSTDRPAAAGNAGQVLIQLDQGPKALVSDGADWRNPADASAAA